MHIWWTTYIYSHAVFIFVGRTCFQARKYGKSQTYKLIWQPSISLNYTNLLQANPACIWMCSFVYVTAWLSSCGCLAAGVCWGRRHRCCWVSFGDSTHHSGFQRSRVHGRDCGGVKLSITSLFTDSASQEGDFPAAGIHAGVYCAQPYTSVEMLTSVEKNIFERWVKGCWCLEFPCYVLLGAYVLRNQFSGWWNNTHLNCQIVFFFNCSCSLLFYNEIKLVKNWNTQDTESRVGVSHVLRCFDARHLWGNINPPNVPSNKISLLKQKQKFK